MQSSIRVPRFAVTDASCHSKTLFPLTPSLSLGELPQGEGWGEGEGVVRMVVASDFMRSLCITVLPS